MKQLLQLEAISIVLHISLCVCARVCVGEDMHMRACVRVWVGVNARERACAYERVSLLIQYAKRRRHIFCVLSGCTLLLTLSCKWHDFRRSR